jgi:hypothetical protein
MNNTDAVGAPCEAATSTQSAPSLSALPDDALSHLAAHLPSIRDVAALACVNRRLRAVCRAAPLCIRLAAIVAVEAPPGDAQRRAQAALKAVCRSFPGAIGLHLAGLPFNNADVAKALELLPGTAFLSVAGCKKLTKEAVVMIAAAPSLRSVDLQRCFQQPADALTALLAAAASPSSHLHGIALSHLDLTAWAPTLPPNTGAITVLALHNCIKLTRSGLHVIITSCPNLEILCLGGTSLALADVDAASDDGEDASFCLVHHESVLNGSIAGIGTGSAAEAQRLRAELSRVAATPPPAAAMPSYSHWLQATAVELAIATAHLARLRVLEITFCAPGLPSLLRRLVRANCIAGAAAHRKGPGASPPAIWNACDAHSVADMRQFKTVDAFPSRNQIDASKHAWKVSEVDAELALQTVARCSSPGRVTPLHAAAEDGNVRHVEDLLVLGADVLARDRGGATPLFTACEAGHADVASRLLAAGADVMVRNAANENPLYIASLRGHSAVLEALLNHCAAHHVDWTDPRNYGDGWTPVHAAAVSGRVGIAAQLLTAAGPNAGALVRASNRYGQTSMHVAARKGTPALLSVLLAAGGRDSLSLADVDGRTAADVARRNGNAGAWRLLTGKACACVAAARQKGTTPTVEKGTKQVYERPAGQRWVGRRLQQRRQQSKN